MGEVTSFTAEGRAEGTSTVGDAGQAQRRRQGPVMRIGGAEHDRQGEVICRYGALSVGRRVRIGTMPTPSEDPQRSGEGCAAHFRAPGAGKVDPVRSERRVGASAEATLGPVREPTGSIDRHGSERGRMGRVLSIFAANPGSVGVGLDEDTAVLITREGVLEMPASGMVTLLDGRDATSDHVAREAGEVLPVVKSSRYLLGPGRRFDQVTRQPIDARSVRDAAWQP